MELAGFEPATSWVTRSAYTRVQRSDKRTLLQPRRPVKKGRKHQRPPIRTVTV